MLPLWLIIILFAFMRKLSNDELNRLSPQEYKQAEKTPVVIVLDNIRSMMNIGSVFRTSDAFRIHSVLLCGITACPPNKEIHKTALGATESVDWRYYENTIDAVQELAQQGFEIYSIEQAENSIMLNDFMPSPDKKYALVFGNEIQGVGQDVVNLSHGCIEIPQIGTKHSLNISVAAGVVIWDVVSKLGLFN